MKIDFINSFLERENLTENFNSVYSKELINKLFDTVIYTSNGDYKDYKNENTYDVSFDNTINNIHVYREDDKFWVDISFSSEEDNISITEVIENSIIIRNITLISGFKYSIKTYIYEDVVDCLHENHIDYTIEKISKTGIIPDHRSEFSVQHHVLYDECNNCIKKIDSYSNLIRELVKASNSDLVGYDFKDKLSTLYVEETKKGKIRINSKKH